mmetsp:Transcript_14031/g.45644  ORF Transcript_14031/g.45644 Transcript_14031/m.45644 type:complete len:251 (-) Transcript_14031:604-1356(-)
MTSLSQTQVRSLRRLALERRIGIDIKHPGVSESADPTPLPASPSREPRGVKPLLDQLPHDHEERALQPVDEQSGPQPAPEQAGHTVLGQDGGGGGGVGEGGRRRLARRLEHAQPVGEAIRDCSRQEADHGALGELRRDRRGLVHGQSGGEGVEGQPPGQAAEEGGGHVGERAVVQDADPSCPHLLAELRPAGRPLHLQRRLDAVERSDREPPAGGDGARAGSALAQSEARGGEEREHARLGGRVAEADER